MTMPEDQIDYVFNPVTEEGHVQYGERLCSSDCEHRADGVPVINLRLIFWIIGMWLTGRPWSAHTCRLFGRLHAFQDGSRIKVERHPSCHRCEQWLLPRGALPAGDVVPVRSLVTRGRPDVLDGFEQHLEEHGKGHLLGELDAPRGNVRQLRITR